MGKKLLCASRKMSSFQSLVEEENLIRKNNANFIEKVWSSSSVIFDFRAKGQSAPQEKSQKDLVIKQHEIIGVASTDDKIVFFIDQILEDCFRKYLVILPTLNTITLC